MKKKVNTRELVDKIAKITRERMLSGSVVDFENIKNNTMKKTPPTLLVVEDDEIIRKSLKRIFESSDYRVLVASNGGELTDVLYETYIDLILLDVGLPWVDGFELAQMMKDHSELSPVPIVFISGNSDKEAIKKGFSVGAHDYITKPFNVEVVKKTVDTLLKLSGAI